MSHTMDESQRYSFLAPLGQHDLPLDLQVHWSRPHINEEQRRPRIPRQRNIAKKASETWLSLLLLAFMSIFVVLFSLYVYQAMLSPTVRIGSLMLSASDTNLLVSILSQVFSEILQHLVLDAFDLTKWTLAGRERGVSITTFFAMSGATQWLTALCLSINGVLYHFWGPLRLSLPLLGLYFGSILKFQADFEYFFEPNVTTEISVFAGQISLDQAVLDIVPPSLLALYFAAWTPTLLGVERFAIQSSAPNCTGNCTASFLPGGVEMVRKVHPTLNVTILDGGLFDHVDTIQVRDVPGLLLRFEDTPPDFEFDLDDECTTYGMRLNDPVQVCIKTMNGSLAVGWRSCPQNLFNFGFCNKTNTWREDQVQNTVIMTTFKQRATTSYRRRDFSILNVEMTGEPVMETLKIKDFKATWDRVFLARNSSTSPERDIMMTGSFTSSLAWLIRLYHDLFPDDKNSPRRFIENFLSIPQQFMMACYQYSNYTTKERSLPRFVVPDDLMTTAVGGKSTQRFAGQPWVVWLFITTAIASVLAVIGLFSFALTQRTLLPGSTGIPDLDIISIAGDAPEGEDPGTGIRDLVRRQNMGTMSAWQLSRALRRRNVKLVAEGQDLDRASLRVIHDRRGSVP